MSIFTKERLEQMALDESLSGQSVHQLMHTYQSIIDSGKQIYIDGVESFELNKAHHLALSKIESKANGVR